MFKSSHLQKIIKGKCLQWKIFDNRQVLVLGVINFLLLTTLDDILNPLKTKMKFIAVTQKTRERITKRENFFLLSTVIDEQPQCQRHVSPSFTFSALKSERNKTSSS